MTPDGGSALSGLQSPACDASHSTTDRVAGLISAAHQARPP
ncbi:conserved hypothetical protein [Citrobacter rodentium ICC168]|uniref:Uncharacterized protein n=1 Tax=Citrobacter rodentium (strain ICC168) TaxID=637910 RepID=D2TUY4_CITRI|nr:conserved hypothetical protein [Citrobacter rodentium ICC168]